MTRITKDDVPVYGDYDRGEVIDIGGGYSVVVKLDFDDCGPPWENSDGHGPVSDWTTRAKRPGERVLCDDRSHKRFYDFAAAVEQAKRENWGAPPYEIGTKGEKAVRAANADFEFLRGWCTNQWHYLVVDLTLYFRGTEIDEIDCGWIESLNDYWREWVAGEVNAVIAAHKEERAETARAARHERNERRYWAARDVITTA